MMGFSILEIVVGIAVISMAMFGFMIGARNMLRISNNTGFETQSSFLLEGGIESLRAIRDEDWTLLDGVARDTWLYIDNDLALIENWISPVPAGILPAGFSRRFKAFDVMRDANDDIVESGGVLDTETLRFVVEVSWKNAGSIDITRSAETYLTNFFGE